jgi:hypothetical protein
MMNLEMILTKEIALYALNKIIKYKYITYPAYLFIALDDAASS